ASITSGSPGSTPNNTDCSSRDPANASTAPATIPAPATARLCRNTSATTDDRDAPSAIRNPISRTRRLTAYDNRPYSPTTASTAATTAKRVSSEARNFGCATARAASAASGVTVGGGSAGATSLIAARNAGAATSGRPDVRATITTCRAGTCTNGANISPSAGS